MVFPLLLPGVWLRYLLAKYQDKSFYLVFDFDIDKTRPSLISAVQNFAKEKCSSWTSDGKKPEVGMLSMAWGTAMIDLSVMRKGLKLSLADKYTSNLGKAKGGSFQFEKRNETYRKWL